MANPRKFSEKIALHTHRQAEETARFEQIMREVSDATARPEDTNIISHSHRESRARSQGGPIRRPQDRKHDTSPYSPGPFLSPPPDTSWRRANSDSALHQSAMQGINSERNDNSNNRWMMPSMNGPEHHDGRPKSSCEVPRVPGINIYPSAHEPGTIQIPIGNNTGSLPDLTSVHFPPPISTPLDQDGDNNQGSSPYGSSPVNTSPSTLSPTSLQHGVRQGGGRFQFASPASPPHHQQQQQNHLSVPVNSRYLHHHPKTIDKRMPLPPDAIDYAQLAGMGSLYQQPIPQTFQSPNFQFQQMAGHRSPRPSPQSSPGLGGRHSAPCSPGAPSPLPNDSAWLSTAADLQHHLANFSMVDTPVSDVSYMDPGHHLTQTHPQAMPEVSGAASELLGDGGYYSTSPSQLVYPTAPPSTHTTPNTPTGIPDIIFTDCSMGESALVKQLETDFLDNDLLREGLEPLDSEQIELLQDTGFNFISSNVEDSFRLGHS